ncbi:fibronectin type III domain-containing protein [Geomesophilobacter sediminis]|uniref:Fibronectin type III domain-containing protein n=1 Tax=Geomesophilobacter sediminis TaxID=2798584 RepID=A0A8J7JDU1_9BACT|nr:fibronectin type III domain-containing protein [Geomesophilobacter sediminis]MBJ6723909.1 fibronectin type III domain-containing protein [Geomesophilobacter sediminis]
MAIKYPINVFDTSFLNGTHLEVATHIIGIGQSFKAHRLYQQVPEGVPHGDEIIDVGTRYHDVSYAVIAGDNGKKGERDSCGEKAVLTVGLALNWAGMRYLRENDPEYIINLGVDHAAKKTTSRSMTPVVPGTPEKVDLEHGQFTGTLRVLLPKVTGAITYFVQACQGDPSVESNWNQEWQFTKVKGGLLLTGLEPGKIYYVRVRCLGHGGFGHWSTYVRLMVV